MPYALGDVEEHMLHVKYIPMTISLYQQGRSALDLLQALREVMRV